MTSLLSYSAVFGLGLGIGAGCVAFAMHGRITHWRSRSQHWFSVAMGEKPMLDEGGAQRLVRDLFANTTTRDVVKGPRVSLGAMHEVERQREWREQRALRSRDHQIGMHVFAASDADAAEWCIAWANDQIGGDK